MVKIQWGADFTRRDSFRLATMTGLALWAESYAFAASDFWNKKQAAEWTDQEKEELKTKSPWAKKVDPESGGGGAGGGGGDNSGGSGGGRGGGRGGGGGGGGGGLTIPTVGGLPTPLSVVWQSAKPIQDAHPLALPPQLNNHYVIGVTGISPQAIGAAMRGGRGGSGGQGSANPAPPGSTTPAAPPDPTAGLKQGATLTVKGKTPQNADIVLEMNGNQTLLFSFAKEVLALTLADKEVQLDLKLGNLTAKAKFNLKDMMYGEVLAL